MYYRACDGVFRFSKENNKIMVKPFESTNVKQDLMKVDHDNYTTNPHKLGACVLVELAEDERNPRSGLPLLVTISTREARETLKELSKMSTTFLLVGPPTREQVIFMEKKRIELGISPWYSKQNHLDVIEEMLDEVGPIPRAFTQEPEYHSRMRSLNSTGNQLTEGLLELKKLSIYNVPQFLKSFLAPYPLTDDPKIHAGFEFKFLSNKAADVFEAYQTNDTFSLLDFDNSNDLIAERIVRKALKSPNEELTKDWDWMEDVGFEISLCQDHMIRNPSFKFPVFHSNRILRDALPKVSVSWLEENVLYSSKSPNNFRLGDFFYVDHAKKTIYFIQVTLKSLCNHEVNIDVVETVLSNLCMLADENLQYQLHFIFVVDRATKNLTGSAFFDPSLIDTKSDPKVNMKKLTLQEWQEEDKKNIARRVHTSIILATLSNRDLTPPK